MDSEAERLRRGLRHYFDAAGKVLREKPHPNTRFMARHARQRARLGLEALERGDMPEAHKLYQRALEAHGTADRMLAHERLAPGARRWRAQKQKSMRGHAKAYGTREEIEERYRTYARQFWALVEQGKPKEKAYARVARFHGVSDGPVRTAVRRNKTI